MTTIMRLYIPLSSNQGPRQFSPRFFCKARARDVSVTHAKLLWFDKTRGRAHESDRNSARTILLLPTNMSTSGLKSTKMSLYDCMGHGQDLYPQFSSEGGSPGLGCRTGTKPRLYTLVTHGCSGRGSLCRHATRSAESADSTQLFPFQ